MRGAGARFRALTALYATDLYTAIRAVQLEMANMPGGRINERSCAIRDVAARDSYVARRWRDDGGLFAHANTFYPPGRARTPGRVRALAITPDITAPTRVGRHASAGGGRAISAAAVHHDGREDALTQGPTSCTTREWDRTRGSTGAGRRWRSGRGR